MRSPRNPTTTEIGRRQFLRWQCGAMAGCFLGLPGTRSRHLLAQKAPAQAVIHIWLSGGLSHLDTLDPKPYAPLEVRGPFKTIETALGNHRFSELLPQTAKIADQLIVIPSMTHGEAAHTRGTHSMLTGYKPSPAITYPSMGSVVAHELGGRNDLPAYVCVPNAREEFMGTGYLSTAFAPFGVGGEPNSSRFKVRDLGRARGLSEERLHRRRMLLEEQDRQIQDQVQADPMTALTEFYRQAYALMDSPKAQSAFDIRKEARKVRSRYGNTNLGQRLLLARRLVEYGCRYVTVSDGGYDHHRDIGRGLRGRVRDLDRGFAALLNDLKGKGLLDSTLVLLTTEFGRTPRINDDDGRDHWARCFSIAMAGGGLKRGLVHGASDATGAEPKDNATSPADYAATVFHQMGIDPRKKLMSPGNRPIDLVRDGRVMKEWIA